MHSTSSSNLNFHPSIHPSIHSFIHYTFALNFQKFLSRDDITITFHRNHLEQVDVIFKCEQNLFNR